MGGFLLADGYGSCLIHQYDQDVNWVKCFAGKGQGEGKFSLAHGIWVDKREGREPSSVVTDRSANTIQHLTMDGEYLETLHGFGLPANFDVHGNLLIVPELKAKVTLLNEKNERVATLGDGNANLTDKLRERPKQ